MLTKDRIEKKYPGKKIEKLKRLNLWGEDLENVDIISEMKNLRIISLSANKISSLKPFEKLVNLKELYLRQNNIKNIDEINYLKACPNLQSLWLEENPICKDNEEYKRSIIEKLPNLVTLDNTQVSDIKDEFNKKNNEKTQLDIELDDDKDEKNKDESDLVMQKTQNEFQNKKKTEKSTRGHFERSVGVYSMAWTARTDWPKER